jgi:hypothetical protein
MTSPKAQKYSKSALILWRLEHEIGIGGMGRNWEFALRKSEHADVWRVNQRRIGDLHYEFAPLESGHLMLYLTAKFVDRANLLISLSMMAVLRLVRRRTIRSLCRR